MGRRLPPLAHTESVFIVGVHAKVAVSSLRKKKLLKSGSWFKIRRSTTWQEPKVTNSLLSWKLFYEFPSPRKAEQETGIEHFPLRMESNIYIRVYTVQNTAELPFKLELNWNASSFLEKYLGGKENLSMFSNAPTLSLMGRSGDMSRGPMRCLSLQIPVLSFDSDVTETV